jgi:hypothetical protein
MALFTANTHFVAYMNVMNRAPLQELRSGAALPPVFADLNNYDATMHFVGQSTILSLTPDRGTGETYYLAHHLTVAVKSVGSCLSTFNPMGGDPADRKTELLYFGLITLSTVGYGDIVPPSGTARIVTALEGVTGVLYIATRVALLVSRFRNEFWE